MSEIKQTFNSSLGKKLIMALTGLFLCTFIIVHMAGNLFLFKNDQGYGFNVYANFLTHFPPIEVIAYFLYLTIIVHAVYALVLTIKNRKSRPVAYAYTNKAPASWSSKNMGLLGAILLFFIVVHMRDFWFTYKFDNVLQFKEYRTNLATGERTVTDIAEPYPGFENAATTDNGMETVVVKDLHARVAESFSNLWYVALYVIAMGALAFHLYHGFQSAFQTLGWTHRKYSPIVKFIGKWFFAVFIPIVFALMPIVYYIQSLSK